MADRTVVFCRAGCGKCAGLQRWLRAVRVDFVVRDVYSDPAAADEVVRLGFATLPVVLTPDGHAAAGADPATLTAELPALARAADMA